MSLGFSVRGMELDELLGREWVAANGLGGYASSTVPGLNTRKYHGLLVAAMTPPVRRMVLLSRMEETLWCDGRRHSLDCNEYPDVIYPQGQQYLTSFRSHPCPRWIYQGEGWRLEKRLRLLRGQNSVVLSYRLAAGDLPVDLELRPLFGMRPIHELSYQWNGPLLAEDRGKGHERIPPTSRTPEVFFAHDGQFFRGPNWYLNQIYRREQQRGYAGLEDLWTPGPVRYRLAPGRTAHFVCSADPIVFADALRQAKEQYSRPRRGPSPDPAMDALRRAADAFVVSVPQDGQGERAAFCMSGYPWAAPSGRDALISFTGLLLVPGRFAEAKSLLSTFASKLHNGLMPSGWPECGGPPEYRGADISLWFVDAVWDFLRYAGDDAAGEKFLDVILRVIADYRHGTELGIGADDSGLLVSRAPGVPTSWMNAKVGDWIVTQRVGRPVELNALWYNAVRIAAELSGRFARPERTESLATLAESIRRAFNARFWNEKEQCCFDVVEDHGPDPSIRPNQLLAISLPFPVLDLDRHGRVLAKVKAELLTPLGVRTLSPADPGYHGRYEGGVLARDRACHNGTAFPWLLGPYVRALLNVRGRGQAARQEAHAAIRPCLDYLMGRGLGQICELFDGDALHASGGQIASAASVGQILRCYAEDVLDMAPPVPCAVAAHPSESTPPVSCAKL